MQVHDTTNNRVTAELIFTGGKVHTVNARNDIVEAVAVGVPVAGSSDAPVTPYAPLFGIEQALTRKTIAGNVCGPDESVWT